MEILQVVSWGLILLSLYYLLLQLIDIRYHMSIQIQQAKSFQKQDLNVFLSIQATFSYPSLKISTSTNLTCTALYFVQLLLRI